MNIKELLERVPNEANPPAVMNRLGAPDLVMEILLDDLVQSGAWLDRELKEPFLALWVNEPDFDDPDLDDPIVEIDYNNVLAFAAMEPVVELKSLLRKPTSQ